jgi:hypothetical protein
MTSDEIVELSCHYDIATFTFNNKLLLKKMIRHEPTELVAVKSDIINMPKKTKTTKRISDDDENGSVQIDVQYNPDIITGLLQELSQRVDNRCTQIQTDADFHILHMQQQFQIDLLTIPTDIKKMTMAKFLERFSDANINTSQPTKFRQPLSLQPNTTRPLDHNFKIFQTPHGFRENISSTRQPKEGEIILSTNGSPLGEFTTVQKAPKNPAETIIPQTPGVFVPLKTGEVIDIDEVNMENLDPLLKEDALAKMQAMMDNMQRLMSRMKTRL